MNIDCLKFMEFTFKYYKIFLDGRKFNLAL